MAFNPILHISKVKSLRPNDAKPQAAFTNCVAELVEADSIPDHHDELVAAYEEAFETLGFDDEKHADHPLMLAELMTALNTIAEHRLPPRQTG